MNKKIEQSYDQKRLNKAMNKFCRTILYEQNYKQTCKHF